MIKNVKHEIAELDYRYKKQMCLLKTDIPIEMSQVTHSLISRCFQDQMEFVLPNFIKRQVELSTVQPESGLTREGRKTEQKK